MSNTITQTSLNEFHIPRWNELPNVALYLDQVVTLINSCLSPILSYNIDKKENPILTKTMINNYVKNNLIEAPDKKKYGKNAIIKRMNLEEGATTMERNDQIGGHKG